MAMPSTSRTRQRSVRWLRRRAGWSDSTPAATGTPNSPGGYMRRHVGELARRVPAAVAKTTGVSRTMVASRLSAAVTSDARTNTTPSSRRGEPWLTRPATAPKYVKTPASAHRCESTSIAARNPTVGPKRDELTPCGGPRHEPQDHDQEQRLARRRPPPAIAPVALRQTRGPLPGARPRSPFAPSEPSRDANRTFGALLCADRPPR